MGRVHLARLSPRVRSVRAYACQSAGSGTGQHVHYRRYAGGPRECGASPEVDVIDMGAAARTIACSPSVGFSAASGGSPADRGGKVADDAVFFEMRRALVRLFGVTVSRILRCKMRSRVKRRRSEAGNYQQRGQRCEDMLPFRFHRLGFAIRLCGLSGTNYTCRQGTDRSLFCSPFVLSAKGYLTNGTR